MHSKRGSAKPQWRLSNTVMVANSSSTQVTALGSSSPPPPSRGEATASTVPHTTGRTSLTTGRPPPPMSATSQLAELVTDDDDEMLPLPPHVHAHHSHQHSGHHSGAATLPELRPTTSSIFSRSMGELPQPGASPVLPGEQGPSSRIKAQPGTYYAGSARRHTVSSVTGEGGTSSVSPRPPSTMMQLPQHTHAFSGRHPQAPSRLDRTIDRLSRSALGGASTGGGQRSASPRMHTASTTRTPMPSYTTATTMMTSPYAPSGEWGSDGLLQSSAHRRAVVDRSEEATLEEIRITANAIAPSTTPRFLPLSTKQALQNLQHAIRSLVTSRSAGEMGSVPNLLLTTYNIVCKQVFHDSTVVVHTHDAEMAHQPRSLFDTFAHGGEDTTIATELRDLQRELLLTKKHYHVAIQQIDIFKHRLTEHVNEIRRLEKVMDHANAIELDLRGTISELRQTILTKGMEVSELRSNIVALHSSMHDAQKHDHSKISERTADLRQELVSLYEQVRQSEEMTKSYEREISNLNSDVQRIEGNFEDSQQKLAEAHSTLAAREDEVYEARLKAMEHNKKVAALETTIEDLLVVQGDTMLQDKMIRENHLWGSYKDELMAVERARKLEDPTIPSHIKSVRGYGVEESVPLWLRGEGKIKPKFLNKADTVHMALQALTDLSLPASLAGNTRSILAARSGGGGGGIMSFRLGGTPAGLAPQMPKGSRGGPSSGGRDDAALGSIGLPSGPLSGFGGAGGRRSIVGITTTQDFSADIASRHPFSDAFKLWLSRTGTDNLNNKQGTELAYGFHHSLQRWASDPDMVLFNAILRGDAPPEIHYHCYRTLDDLLNVFIAADEEMHKGEARRSLPITTVARVLKKAVQLLPAAYATEQDAEHLLFLLTLDFNIPYVPYRSLFDYDDEGGRHLFLREYFSLVVARTLEYYDVLQTVVEVLGTEALRHRQDDDSNGAAVGSTAMETDEALRRASQKSTMSVEQSDFDKQSSHSSHDDDIGGDAGEQGSGLASSYPGHGHPTRPVPAPLRDVTISLERFGALWAVEDPGMADNIVELLSFLRTTMLGGEAKKRAEAEAAQLKAEKAIAAARGNRTLRSVPPTPPTRPGAAGVQPGGVAPPPPAEDVAVRDAFTVEQLVTALRQLCLTRSSHRLLPMTMPTPSMKPSIGQTSEGGDVDAAELLGGTPSNMIKSLSFEAATPSLQGDDTGGGDDGHFDVEGNGPLSFTLAPSQQRRRSSGPHGLPEPLPTTADDVSSTVGGGVARHASATTSFAGVGLLPSMSMAAAYGHAPHMPPEGAIAALVPPPREIEPRFHLAAAVNGLYNNSNSYSRTPGLMSANTPGVTSFRDLGSVASHSLAGGTIGVTHSRARLQALAKRSNTALPPFFKSRLLR